MAKADVAARKAMEQELARLKVETGEAEAEALNSQLSNALADIDNILRATLEVDDYVDLANLRKLVEHPPFSSAHQAPLPMPSPNSRPARRSLSSHHQWSRKVSAPCSAAAESTRLSFVMLARGSTGCMLAGRPEVSQIPDAAVPAGRGLQQGRG